MPPPHSFWVILIGKTPTSFRGKEREDLVPTLRQLQRTQSDVTLRWFERGKIWESPEAALGAAKLAATMAREKRTKEWRPGGEHRDPKARFELTRDQKRAKFKRERTGDERPPRDERPRRPEGPGSPRSNDERPQSPFGPRPPKGPRPDRPWSDRSKPSPRPERARQDRPWSERPKFDRPKPGGSPFADRGPRPPRGDDRDRPPQGDGRDRPPRGVNRDRPPRGDSRERSEGRQRPSGPPRENPFKDRPRGDHRPPPGRPGRPSGPGGDRGGFKPPRRRS